MKLRAARDFWQRALDCCGNCPDFADLESPSEAVAAHLRSCERCHAEAALLRAFQRLQPSADEAADVDWILDRYKWSGTPERTPWWRRIFQRWPAPAWIVSLIVLALLAVGAVQLRKMRTDFPADSVQAQTTQIGGLAPSGEQADLPGSFRWDPWPGAARYEVTITESAGSAIVSAISATEPHAELDGAVRAALQAGRTLQWKVTALGSAGETLSESAPVTIHSAPKP